MIACSLILLACLDLACQPELAPGVAGELRSGHWLPGFVGPFPSTSLDKSGTYGVVNALGGSIPGDLLVHNLLSVVAG